MKLLQGMLVAILGGTLLLCSCETRRAQMAFHGLDPDFGGLQGGKPVRVRGDNIRLDIGYAVYFGDSRASRVSIQSDQALLAITPRRPGPGRVDVTIRADNGAVFVLKRGFEYIDQAGSLFEDSDRP